MRNKNHVVLVFALALAWAALPVGAKNKKPDPVYPMQAPNDSPNITWHGQFGTSKDTPDEIYCLMGYGFLKTPVSKNFDGLVKGWMAKHPDAKIVRVFNYGPVLDNKPNLSQTYVWVVDGGSNLNEYLVREGACPGLTMFVPEHEGPNAQKMGHFLMEIPQADYLDFLDRISADEKQAQKAKLGIWKPGGAATRAPKK